MTNASRPAASTRRVQLAGGQIVSLRPINPEDVAALRDMVRRSDANDVRLRFFNTFSSLPVALAKRLSLIDPASESATVAVDSMGDIVGVVRLAGKANDGRAEYAIMVRSDMKRHGLGRILMRAMLEDARARGLQQVYGHVMRENGAMLALASRLGFSLAAGSGDLVETSIAPDLATPSGGPPDGLEPPVS